ncbi:MAG TPA: DUF1937 family protein, partial [Planctomycetaceae bacterium]|nr:DUF1937 family protein [Planctomycetaceae bacterium]
PDPSVREFRFREACRAAAKLMRLGKAVFSPIAHSHCICMAMENIASSSPRGMPCSSPLGRCASSSRTRMFPLDTCAMALPLGPSESIRVMRMAFSFQQQASQAALVP